MGSRKLVRDLFQAKQLVFPLQSRQVVSSRLRLVSTNNGLLGFRRFSVFNEFSEKLKGEVKNNPESGDSQESYFNWFKSTVSCAAPTVSSALQKMKETKVVDIAKQGYAMVKDELSGKPSKRRHMQHEASSYPKGETSTKTDIVIVPTKQSRWEAFKEKLQGNPVIKRISGISEPVVTKIHELKEDVQVAVELSDNPVVCKIHETVFGETDAAITLKEIHSRDPSFSLPDFVAEVQEMIRPTLIAYFKGDVETLKKNCSPEVIERCIAEKQAYESQGMFFSNKILHISDVQVHETKLMGNSPIIIVAFQTQQIYCVMDKEGSITQGGKDTIQTVFYQWAMQQVDVQDQEEGALYPIWRLRETQQLGMKALI
ncbi:hypothetical protein MKX03_024272 [Papaver bracteatum]|nr:hypothetical protein MKX03_024272 [Papaver bracteatum]